MSSALKPVLTPSGVQNPPVPPQLTKPMHSQDTPTTYGQPISHIPQNLVNIAHSVQTPTNVHGPVHTNMHHVNANTHVSSHTTNHYSLNVPNAPQHYSMSTSTTITSHLTSAPSSNHPVPITTPSQLGSTFTAPSKNISYNPGYQPGIGHSYKLPPTQNIPSLQPQPSEEAPTEKLQSNGTPEVKSASRMESPQNHVATPVKDKPPQQPPSPLQHVVQPPSTTEKTKVVAEKPATAKDSQQNSEEEIDAPAVTEKEALPTPPPAAPHKEEIINVTSSTSVVVTPSTVAVTTTQTSSPPAPTKPTPAMVGAPSAQAPVNKPVAILDTTESQEPEKPIVNTTTTINRKAKEQNNQKSTLKLATTPRTLLRKTKAPKLEISDTPKSNKSQTNVPNQKSPNSGGKSKRNRIRTQPYQSPLPEVELISKISATTPRNKNSEDKLIVFYKNEFLAVRNSEGGFYVCQAVQNIYKSSPRIRIRWLSQDKSDKEIYTPDFYDYTDFDCILTNLNLGRVGKGKYKLPMAEKVRTDSILKRALAVEKGDATPPSLTEEHPDGLDLSLYKEESQLTKRKSLKRKASAPLKASPSMNISKKSPDQPKVKKVSPKPKPLPAKKKSLLKKALSTKVRKTVIGRSERTAKRQQDQPKISIKTSPVIDHKKARVLAKVARKTAVVPQPKNQPPPRQITRNAKPPAKKVVAKKQAAPTIRKSKRGKK